MAITLVPSYSLGDRSFADSASSSDTTRLSMLLAIHAVVWTGGAWLFRNNLDWAGDMLENYSWGIEWQAGYHKHPPLFAWIAAAWFMVFPRTDVAYFALSNVNALVGLCGIVALSRRFLPRRQAAVAGLAMAVSPIYTTLALKFNANTVLLSVWPWTAYFFVRYVQTGTRAAALALGAVAGIAMLGKYFSIALLGGLALAGMARPAWRSRLLQPQAMLAVMAGTIVLWPHMRWLVDTGMQPFTYARERMQEISHPLPAVAGGIAAYALVQVAYVLPGMAFLLMLARQHRGRALKLMLHGYVRRSLNRDLWWLAMGTLLAISVLAFVTGTRYSSLWGNAQWFALAPFWIAMISNAGIGLETRRIPAMMAAYWLLVLGLSGAGGYLRAVHHDKLAMEPRAELARAARRAWGERTHVPLGIVAGDHKEARAVSFYGEGQVHYWDMFDPVTTPWLSEADVRRAGALFVCREDNAGCQSGASAFSGVSATTVSVSKTVWGVAFPERRYVLFIMPPAGQPVMPVASSG